MIYNKFILQGRKHFFLPVILFSACIVVTPPRGKDDRHLEFDKYLQSPEVYSKVYLPITAVEISGKLRESTRLAIVAPWCPFSYQTFKEKLFQKNPNKGNWLIISSCYDIESLEHLTSTDFPVDTIYIIDHRKYGTIESEKIRSFVSDLLKVPIDSTVAGVPQYYLYKSGQLQGPSRNFPFEN